jgi:uncharacterized membrane protein (DUF2068 family)
MWGMSMSICEKTTTLIFLDLELVHHFTNRNTTEIVVLSIVVIALVSLHSNVLLVTMEIKLTSRCIATDIC